MWNALSLYKCTLGLKIINFRSESMNRGEGEMKIIWKKEKHIYIYNINYIPYDQVEVLDFNVPKPLIIFCNYFLGDVSK